ncbi:MAG: phosphotransferase [Bdellovibrionales bacterium]|nr:phosphotransferase [Bdellovibrionales bacterium]
MNNKKFWIDHFNSAEPEIQRRFIALTTNDCREVLKDLGMPISEGIVFESAENRVFGFGDVVLKFYRPGRWSLEALQDEVQFLEDLREAQVPFVRPIGNVRIWQGIYYIVFETISKSYVVAPEILHEDSVRKLVQNVARIHDVGTKTIAASRPQFDPEEMCTGCFEVIKRSGFLPKELQRPYEEFIGELVAKITTIKDIPIQRIHGDTYSGNTMWNSNGPMFMDLDDFQMGPVALDLRLLSSGCRLNTLPESMNRIECRDIQQELILNFYREVRSFPKSWEVLFPLLSACRDIQFDAWFSARWREPGFAENYPSEDITDFAYWKNSLEVLQDSLKE